MAWLSGWDKRIELVIGDYAGDIGASVTWFPATIFLKDANGDSTKVFLEVGANSRQIAITKADGDTELKGEIEDWSYDGGTPANSTAVIHTSATGWVINANTSIFLYYDNDHADNANIDVINTAAGAAVWNAEYDVVYHMSEASNSQLIDSKGTNDSDFNTGDSEASGQIGKAMDYDGAEFTLLPDLGTFDSNTHTVEAFFKAVTDDDQIIIRQYGSGSYTMGDVRLISNRCYFTCTTAAAAQTTLISGVENPYPLGTWTYLAVTRSATHQRIYQNDTEIANGEIASGTTTSVQPFSIAAYWINAETIGAYFNGDLDEIRVSSVTRPAAWLKGTYNTLWDDLFTYGSEETEEVEEVNAIFFGTNQ